jgi:hypothetical protein
MAWKEKKKATEEKKRWRRLLVVLKTQKTKENRNSHDKRRHICVGSKRFDAGMMEILASEGHRLENRRRIQKSTLSPARTVVLFHEISPCGSVLPISPKSVVVCAVVSVLLFFSRFLALFTHKALFFPSFSFTL